MAESTPTQDDLYLRRRARRRLVGAVALALLAVVVLPMVFDSEPRPLGDQVEIHIPDQGTPFVPLPPDQTVLAPAMSDPVARPPAPDAAAGVSPPPANPVTQDGQAGKARPEPAVRPIVKAEAKPAQPAKTQATAKPEAKPVPKVDTKSEPKPVPKVEPKPTPKIETKPETKSDPALKDSAYFLQLGVFSSPANAEAQVAKAKAAGFKASVQRDGARFKVRVGPLAERAKALDYHGKLKAKGLDNVLIEP